MTDLLASTALSHSPAGVVPRATPAAVAGGFDLKLALDCVMPGVAPMTGKPLAGCGKDLPVPGNGVAEGDTDADEALLAWMPEGMLLLPLETPLPARVAVGTPSAHIDGPIADPVDAAAPPVELGEAASLPGDAADGDAFAASLASAPAAPAASPVSTPLRTWRDPVPAQAEPGAGGGVAAAEVRADRATAAAPELAARPTVAPPPVVQAAPAAQVFAAALAAPLVEPLDLATPADPASPEIQLLRSLEVQRTTVQATAQADQAPLDLSRDDWTGKMIERIAALRDGVEAADTRIRLAPENLGTVDVSIRRDGDRIQVHFTAENPATRQLLADAAPRLAELAEARGLKLGQSSVDGGSGERGQQQQQNHPSTPARPASARAATGTASDARVA
ncbi:flagellar hook-length control protein FliK [Sphingomonas sp. R647]|uniref:flagellar hook-length control protein FliK n=1 Tax=Sphingomonas sp. R647 TaxID=2875233 RepID=UPI001CD2C199|nr:flagellar hook-length control protein FliK [Sphingomonas sp. R647]MCA1198613.1 flagellar hook-length control protein FliK [Sphingomonas sp. R647]